MFLQPLSLFLNDMVLLESYIIHFGPLIDLYYSSIKIINEAHGNKFPGSACSLQLIMGKKIIDVFLFQCQMVRDEASLSRFVTLDQAPQLVGGQVTHDQQEWVLFFKVSNTYVVVISLKNGIRVLRKQIDPLTNCLRETSLFYKILLVPTSDLWLKV